MIQIDFGGNAALFLAVTCCFISGVQYGFLLMVGRAESGVNDGFGVCN